MEIYRRVPHRIPEDREAELKLFEKMHRDSLANGDYQTYKDACEGLGIVPEFEEVFAPREKDEDVALERIAESASLEKSGIKKKGLNTRDQHRVSYLTSLVRNFQRRDISFENDFGNPEMAREFLIQYYSPQTKLRGSAKPLVYEENGVRLKRAARDRFRYLEAALDL